MTAVYLINRTPTVLLKKKSPYEILFGCAPSYNHIKVFGCLYYAHNNPRIKDKFASCSKRCIFVGYPYAKKGWRIYDLDHKEFFCSRDVSFHEDVFPFSRNEHGSPLPKRHTLVYIDDDFDDLGENALIVESANDIGRNDSFSDSRGSPSPTTSEISGPPRTIVQQEDCSNARSKRIIHAPSRFEDFVVYSAVGPGISIAQPKSEDRPCGSAGQDQSSIPMVKHLDNDRACSKQHIEYLLSKTSKDPPSKLSAHDSSSGILYSLSKFITFINLSQNHRRFFVGVISSDVEPRSYIDAV